MVWVVVAMALGVLPVLASTAAAAAVTGDAAATADPAPAASTAAAAAVVTEGELVVVLLSPSSVRRLFSRDPTTLPSGTGLTAPAVCGTTASPGAAAAATLMPTGVAKGQCDVGGEGKS